MTVPSRPVVADLTFTSGRRAGGAGRHVHRSPCRFGGTIQGLVDLDRVAGLHPYLDDIDVLEVTDGTALLTGPPPAAGAATGPQWSSDRHAGAAARAGPAAAPPWLRAARRPCTSETFCRPTLIHFLTTPAWLDGTSIVALSVGARSGQVDLDRVAGLTETSMTSTSEIADVDFHR